MGAVGAGGAGAGMGSLGCTAGAVMHVSERAVAYVCGACVVVEDAIGSGQVHIEAPGPREGEAGASVGCVAVCPKAGTVAVAGKGYAAPVVTLHALVPGGTVSGAGAVRGAAELEVSAMAFSRNGSRLATLSSKPDFSLCVWDTQAVGGPALVAKAQVSAALASDAAVGFYPHPNSSRVCICGAGGVAVWTVEETKREGMQLKAHKALAWGTLLDSPFPGQPGPAVTAHTWLATGELVVGLSNNVVALFDTQEGTLLSAIDFTGRLVDGDGARGGVAALHVTVEAVVATFNCGVMALLDPRLQGSTLEICDLRYLAWRSTGARAPADVTRVDGISSVSLSPSMEELLVQTGAGDVLAVRPALFADEPQDQEAGGEAEEAGKAGAKLVVSQYARFHAGAVTGVASLHGDQLASVAADGTFRVWDALTGTQRALIRFAPGVTGLSMDRLGPSAVAVGDSAGAIRILEISPSGAVSTKFEGKLHESPVEELIFSCEVAGGEAGARVLASRGVDDSIALLSVSANGAKVRALGFVPAGDVDIVSFCFDVSAYSTVKVKSLNLLACGSNGQVFSLPVPALGAPFPHDGILSSVKDALQSRNAIARLPHPLTDMVASPHSPHTVLAATASLQLGTFDARKMSSSASVHADHEGSVVFIALADIAPIIASGSDDGSIVFRTSTMDFQSKVRAHDALAGGVSTMTVTLDGDRLLTCGDDGAIKAMQLVPDALSNKVFFAGPRESRVVMVTTAEEFAEATGAPGGSLGRFSGSPPDFIASSVAERVRAEEAEFADSRGAMERKIEDLRVEFMSLLERSEKAPEMERIDRSEFFLDQEKVAQVTAEGEAAVAAYMKQAFISEVEDGVMKDRCKSLVWDTLEDVSFNVTGMRPGASNAVPSYPTLKRSADYNRRAAKIALLRNVEKLERKARPNSEANIFQMLATNRLSGKHGAESPRKRSLEASLNKLEEGAVEEEEEDDEDFDPASPAAQGGGEREKGGAKEDSSNSEMAYAELELYTPRRRISQMYFLADKVLALKHEFNNKVKRALELKHSEWDLIKERNARINEIIEEIEEDLQPGVGSTHTYVPDTAAMRRAIFTVDFDRSEDPENVLNVADDEIKVEKVLTKMEREAAEAARQKELEAERRAAANDAPRRALQDMMNGTLERKKERRPILLKEEWMLSIPEGEMTDEQVKNLREFEKRFEASEVEKADTRTALEAEFKTLAEELEATVSGYDAKLVELAKERLATSKRIKMEELKIVLVGNASQNDATASGGDEEASIEEEIKSLADFKTMLEGRVAQVMVDIESRKYAVEQLSAEERGLERAFRKDFASLAGDHFEHLSKLYRLRDAHLRWGKGGKRKASVSAGNMRDPFTAVERAVAEEAMEASVKKSPAEQRAIDRLDSSSDMPEGLDFKVWEGFVEARASKIEIEAMAAQAAEELAAVEGELAEMHSELTSLQAKEVRAREMLEDFRENNDRGQFDLDLFFELKQGQLELDQAAVVDDMQDARFLNIEEVQALNEEIQRLGKDIVGLLTERKVKNREMYQIEWENRRKVMQEGDLAEKIRELQLLRVTKDLFKGLKGESEGATALENRLQQQIARGQTMHAKKVDIKEKTIRKVRKSEGELLADMDQLKLKCFNAEHTIRMRRAATNKLEVPIPESALDDESAPEITVDGPKKRTMTTTLKGRKDLPTESTGDSLLMTQRMGSLKNTITNSKLKAIALKQREEIEILLAERTRLRNCNFPSFVSVGNYGPDDR